MHDRLSVETRLTLQRAEDEAIRCHHARLASEHLLLALLRDEATARLLIRAGITQEDVRSAVSRTCPRGPLPILDDELPLAADAEEVLWCAAEEAEGFGHDVVRNPHLLIGLVKEDDGLAGRILEGFGASVDGFRHEALELFVDLDEAA